MPKFDNFYIMGVDPGSRTLGVCMMELSPELDIVSVSTHNVIIDSEDNVSMCENIVYRMRKLRFIIQSLYTIYNPAIISMESSFINASRMGAVIPLTKSIALLESVLNELDRFIKMTTIPPSVIKKVFKARQKGKEAVTEALENNSELSHLVDVNKMSEHEIDATAIAFTLREYLKVNKGMMCIRYLQP